MAAFENWGCEFAKQFSENLQKCLVLRKLKGAMIDQAVEILLHILIILIILRILIVLKH